KNILKCMYFDKNRYSNFGSVIKSLEINGFRGIKKLTLNINFPVTAISGLNGAGKSTLGQLAICAYKKPVTAREYKRLYIKDFFPVSKADPAPFDNDASVIYKYETNDSTKTQDVTVTRIKSSWSGYKRQPERHCFYIGFTVYIPKVERRDISVYGGKDFDLTERRSVDHSVILKMAKIIGHPYDDIAFQGISHRARRSEIGIVERLGYSYSENNMGFGEGRVLYTVDMLETAPEQSLFVLEEPETSLHESAQYEFAKYLMEVCQRRKHQIILSTHSSVILNALPPDARKLLIRDQTGVYIKDGISTTHVRSILSDGQFKGLHICVEDQFAKVLLSEVIRAKRRDILKSIQITDIGDKDAVRQAVEVFKKAGLNVIAVRDADVGENIKDDLFSFPGNRPPEVEVFQHEEVKKFLYKEYHIDFDWLIKKEGISDHHNYTQAIAKEAECEEEVIRTLAIKKYIEIIDEKFDPLITNIVSKIK
ncbi:TPA: AAA family ATPase, partial [Escherichia coli]|nr:AAA family ATPase [Escherichia coli]